MFFFFFILFRANARAAPLGPKQAADEVSGKSKILNGIELSYFSIKDIENHSIHPMKQEKTILLTEFHRNSKNSKLRNLFQLLKKLSEHQIDTTIENSTMSSNIRAATKKTKN